MATLLSGLVLAACGGSSSESSGPEALGALYSDIVNSTAVSPYAYTAVLETTGTGDRRFTRVAWPHHIDVELSCGGGDLVTARIKHQFGVKVACGPGSGGDSSTIGKASILTVTASPGTHWSMIVAAGHRRSG